MENKDTTKYGGIQIPICARQYFIMESTKA